MRPAFTNAPQVDNMLSEAKSCTDGNRTEPCLGIDILCVECGWSGHFCDGSTDHFFNHKCKLRTQSVSTGDL